MQRIRVLFAICDMAAGGSQRQLLNLLERLDRSLFEPHLFLISHVGELLDAVPDDVKVHIADCPGSPRNIFKSAFAHRSRVNELVRVIRSQQIQVIYDRTYHMTLITGGATHKVRIPRASVIVTDPQLDFETNPERLRWLKRRLLRRAYHSADAVLAVSEGVRRASQKYYKLDSHQIETMWNSFDVDALVASSHEPLPAELNRRPDRFRIVSAGRLHTQKGFDVLIESIRRVVHEHALANVELVIAGTGEQERELRTQIADGQLADHVTLCGYLANPLPLFRSADLFCLSSRYEGMPNVLVEAMCCDVPVLATDCPSGPRDILQDRFGTLVPVDDAAALAGAIASSIRNPEPSRQQAQGAGDHIRQTFGIEAGIANAQELLMRLAQSDQS